MEKEAILNFIHDLRNHVKELKKQREALDSKISKVSLSIASQCALFSKDFFEQYNGNYIVSKDGKYALKVDSYICNKVNSETTIIKLIGSGVRTYYNGKHFGKYSISVINCDDSVFKVITEAEFLSLSQPEPHNANDVKYVDLGLPSGTLWADRNLGASKPEDYGNYFQWGDTVGYSGDDAKIYCDDDTAPFNKYKKICQKKRLIPEYDAIYKETKGGAHMPSGKQVEELLEYTTGENITINGINGCKFTSKINNNFIFFPYSGSILNNKDFKIDHECFIWTNEKSVEYGCVSSLNVFKTLNTVKVAGILLPTGPCSCKNIRGVID